MTGARIICNLPVDDGDPRVGAGQPHTALRNLKLAEAPVNDLFSPDGLATLAVRASASWRSVLAGGLIAIPLP
jgi:hypothetical protein